MNHCPLTVKFCWTRCWRRSLVDCGRCSFLPICSFLKSLFLWVFGRINYSCCHACQGSYHFQMTSFELESATGKGCSFTCISFPLLILPQCYFLCWSVSCQCYLKWGYHRMHKKAEEISRSSSMRFGAGNLCIQPLIYVILYLFSVCFLVLSTRMKNKQKRTDECLGQSIWSIPKWRRGCISVFEFHCME